MHICTSSRKYHERQFFFYSRHDNTYLQNVSTKLHHLKSNMERSVKSSAFFHKFTNITPVRSFANRLLTCQSLISGFCLQCIGLFTSFLCFMFNISEGAIICYIYCTIVLILCMNYDCQQVTRPCEWFHLQALWTDLIYCCTVQYLPTQKFVYNQISLNSFFKKFQTHACKVYVCGM